MIWDIRFHPKVDLLGGVHLEDEVVETTALISRLYGGRFLSLIDYHRDANGNGECGAFPSSWKRLSRAGKSAK
jgi:hypothetical protein